MAHMSVPPKKMIPHNLAIWGPPYVEKKSQHIHMGLFFQS